MTCLFGNSTGDHAVYSVLVRIGLPMFLMTLVLSFFILYWIKLMASSSWTAVERRQYICSRAIITCLVTSFFVYQSFSEDLIGIFSCIELDSKELSTVKSDYDNATAEVYYSNFSTARGIYWTEDTRVECFESNHLYLALFLGIPGILVFLIGFPAFMLGLLHSKRKNQLLVDIDVLNTYGFLYQNYEESFVYWEVVILIRKALISTVIVFAYPLGANLQVALTLAVLVLALALHLLSHPFKYWSLNFLEGCALSFSISALIVGLVLNDEKTSSIAAGILAVLLVICGAVLVFFILFALLFYFDKYVVGRLKFLDVAPIPRSFVSRMVFFIKMHFEEGYTSGKAVLVWILNLVLPNRQSNAAGREIELSPPERL